LLCNKKKIVSSRIQEETIGDENEVETFGKEKRKETADVTEPEIEKKGRHFLFTNF